jgi:hypothetical protein
MQLTAARVLIVAELLDVVTGSFALFVHARKYSNEQSLAAIHRHAYEHVTVAGCRQFSFGRHGSDIAIDSYMR